MDNRSWNRNNRGSFRGGPKRDGFARGGNRGWRGNRRSRGQHGPQNQSNYQQWTNRPAKDLPGVRLVEENIGVTEYMTDHKGFNGIIKLRYADFQVSEVNEKGEIAKLTDLKPPEPPAEKEVDDDEDLLFDKYNLEILPMETWDQINTLAVSPTTCTDVVEIDVKEMSKEQRTKIHDAVKKAFGRTIVGSTVNIGEKKFMRFTRFRKGVYIDNRVKWTWPGEYVHFIVYKENIDTMEAATKIAERLRPISLKPSMVGYAGTKDRRAKTSQWFSLRKVDPRHIALSCGNTRDLRLGNYSFHDRPIKLGMLKGNLFRIALRNVEEPEEVVESACCSLRDRGFINYYGLQRFGSRVEMPTWDIGKKLLQGNYKEVVDGILEERPGALQEVLRAYRECGPEAAVRAVPRRCRGAAGPHHSELRLLRALARNPKDLLSAIQQIPRNVRLLYAHAYQSFVYNRALTHRLRALGARPAPGDLVPLAPLAPPADEICENDIDVEDSLIDLDSEHDDDSKDDGGNDSDDNNDTNASRDEQDFDDTKSAKSSDDKPTDGDKIGKPKAKIEVKVLTEEDIANSRYTIYDVVLPLPGNDIQYPPNMKDFYEEILKKDGLTLSMKHKIKSYSMSGAYRRVAVRPTGVRWSCVRYSDPHADLLRSDLDELEGKDDLGIDPEGKYKAVLLTMQLPASCYATMALRELMKVDTSSMTQALQNDYHKPPDTSTKRPAEPQTDEEPKKPKVD